MNVAHLSLQLADDRGLAWAQTMVEQFHYLHKPVDPRGSPIAYLISLEDIRVGCLIFSRPECSRVNGWYGDVEDTQRSPDDPKYWALRNTLGVNSAIERQTPFS
jgi:hypothetical protein